MDSMKELIQPSLCADLQIKWTRLQQDMQLQHADGCLLSVDVNLYYTTAQIFSGYFYLPAEGKPHFFIKRPNGLSGENVHYIRKPEQLPEIFASVGLPMPETLLLEADELSYNEYLRIEKIFAPTTKGNATALLRRCRQVKTPWEIAEIRKSAHAHQNTYSAIKACYKSGMTDLDLQHEIEYVMRRNGSIGMFRAFGSNMDIFMGSILAGDNAAAASPFDFALGGDGQHASCPLGANGTLLTEGTAIMVDMAGNYTAYITDMTRIFSVGKLPEQAYYAHQVSIDIQNAIIAMAKPGIACADLFNEAVRLVEEAQLSAYFMGTKQQAKFVGHGVGIQINELPVLTPRSREVLSAGMVFALEPKFVLPGIGAVGVENTFLVTETGLEKLTCFEESIIEL